MREQGRCNPMGFDESDCAIWIAAACWVPAGHPTACMLCSGSAAYALRLLNHLRNHARRAAAPSLLQLLQRGGG